MLTRRKVLKNGLVAVGSVPLVSLGRRAYADCPGKLQLQPCEDELPIPKPHLPVSEQEPHFQQYPVQPDHHEHFRFQAADEPEGGLPPLLYKVHMRVGWHQFHTRLPKNLVWGYTQSGGDPFMPLVPGSTFRFTQLTRDTKMATRSGALGKNLQAARPVLVRFINNLQPDLRRPCLGFGDTLTTIHFHGGHHPARSDGFPLPLEDVVSCRELMNLFDPFPPGGAFGPDDETSNFPNFFDYYFPNRLAEFSVADRQPDGIGEADDVASFRWYHDHPVDFTGANVYKGLAGLSLTFDEYEADDETGTLFSATNLQLPSGAFDIPLLLQDKRFDANGQMLFNPFEHDGFLGDQFLVNGKIQPYLRVERRKYRFRFLNGSNARIYQMFLSPGANSRTLFHFDQIGNEGGLLTRPVRHVNSFQIAPAQRSEVVIDFADRQFAGVREVFFENRLEQDNGRRPDGLGKGTLILKLILGDEVVRDDPSRVYELLPETPTRRAKDAIEDPELREARRRTFEFDRRRGAWAVNGKLFDHCTRPVAEIALNSTERWRLVNKSGGWAHPIHVHDELMHVRSRNGGQPPLEERDGNSLKDTVYLGPNDEVEVAIRFRDYIGPYVFHCHNIEHEDAFMMAILNVVRGPVANNRDR